MHWRAVSRRMNARLGGDPTQHLCARAYADGWWWLTIPLDVIVLAIWWEWAHCRQEHQRHLWRAMTALPRRVVD